MTDLNSIALPDKALLQTVYLYFAGNFGIFCFTAQSVLALLQKRLILTMNEPTDETVFFCAEYNTAISEITVSVASDQLQQPLSRWFRVRVTDIQDQTALKRLLLSNWVTSKYRQYDVRGDGRSGHLNL